MNHIYYPQGTCSKMIEVQTTGDVIDNVAFMGGCHGNLQGISKLVKGMNIDDVINTLEGIKCGYKSTSCPDQLAQALKQIKAQMSTLDE